MSELEKALYDSANKLVGKTGESTNFAISVTGEKYISYQARFYSGYDIKAWLMELIKVKLNENKGENTIYWRMPPKITKKGDKYELYTRFIISSSSPILTMLTNKPNNSNIDQIMVKG